MEILSFPPRQQMEVVAGGEYKTFTESELDFGEEVGGTSGAGRPKLVQIPAPSASSSLSLSLCQCHCLCLCHCASVFAIAIAHLQTKIHKTVFESFP